MIINDLVIAETANVAGGKSYYNPCYIPCWGYNGRRVATKLPVYRHFPTAIQFSAVNQSSELLSFTKKRDHFSSVDLTVIG